jgi:predicted ester cyclase
MSEQVTVEAFEHGIEGLNNIEDRSAYYDMYVNEGLELPGSSAHNKESLVEMYETVFAGLPDFQLEVKKRMIEDDTVSIVYRWEATHEGELFGHEPTDETIVLDNGMTWMRFEDGQVVERWVPPGTMLYIEEQVLQAAEED